MLSVVYVQSSDLQFLKCNDINMMYNVATIKTILSSKGFSSGDQCSVAGYSQRAFFGDPQSHLRSGTEGRWERQLAQQSFHAHNF